MIRSPGVLSRLGLARVIPVGLFVCGCQGPSPIAVWQQRLTDYVARAGDGDPGVLREASTLRSTQSLRPAQVKFSATGIPGAGLFAATRDVHGVLVGVWSEQGRSRFAFLVGVNEQGSGGSWKVVDIRPIAFEVRGDQVLWRVGDERGDLLERYLAADGPSDGESPGVDRRSRPFPRQDDVFRMEASGGEVLIHDLRSKAAWSLSLTGTHDTAR